MSNYHISYFTNSLPGNIGLSPIPQKVHFSDQRKTGSFFCHFLIFGHQNQQECVTLRVRDGGNVEIGHTLKNAILGRF